MHKASCIKLSRVDLPRLVLKYTASHFSGQQIQGFFKVKRNLFFLCSGICLAVMMFCMDWTHSLTYVMFMLKLMLLIPNLSILQRHQRLSCSLLQQFLGKDGKQTVLRNNYYSLILFWKVYRVILALQSLQASCSYTFPLILVLFLLF